MRRKNEEICESVRENSRAVLPNPYGSERDREASSVRMWVLRVRYIRIFQMGLFERNISGEICEGSSTEMFGWESTHKHTPKQGSRTKRGQYFALVKTRILLANLACVRTHGHWE